MPDSSRVFISYARPDAHIAQAVAAQLRAVGVDYWIDYANLAIGEDWTQTIATGLKSADGVIVISSQRSAESNWVMREIRFAVKSNVPLLPIVVDHYTYVPKDQLISGGLIRTEFSRTPEMPLTRSRTGSSENRHPKSMKRSNVFAQDLAEEASKAGQSTTEAAKNAVFVVHGHDSDVLFFPSSPISWKSE